MSERHCQLTDRFDRALWKRFSRSREDQLWYYGALAAIFAERLPGQLADELREIVAVLARESA